MEKSRNYQIHKKVKKKEMLFEYILISVLVVLLLYMILDTCNLLPSAISNVNLVAVAGIMVSLYALVWQVYSSIKAKRVVVDLGLKADVHGNDVVVSASITNVGTKSIYPLLTNLYVSEGIVEKNGLIETVNFEKVTEHQFNKLNGKGECFECCVAIQCKKEALEAATGNGETSVNYPTMVAKDGRFDNTIRFAYNLRLLSYHSLVHIMPQETFVEDAILTINKPGYYRIFMIYTDKEWKDCICSSTVVKIEKTEDEKS